MVMISANVSPAQAEWKKIKQINWSFIITKGIEAIGNNKTMNDLQLQIDELSKKQQRTAALLQHYASEQTLK